MVISKTGLGVGKDDDVSCLCEGPSDVRNGD
jgi:hypothetical protein